MKKFLLLTFCALFGLVQNSFAQLSITVDGKEVQDNDVIKFFAFEDEYGDILAGTNDPTFKVESGSVNISVTVTIPSNATGGVFQWCGITPDCLPLEPGKYTRSATVKTGLLGPKDMQLHAHISGESDVTYNVKVDVNVNGRKYRTFYLVYIYTQTGIDGVAAQGEGVKFMDNVCHYSFATAAPRALQVYGMDGKLAYNTTVSAAEGSVNLGALQKGAYVYSVVENGKKVQAGKVLVK